MPIGVDRIAAARHAQLLLVAAVSIDRAWFGVITLDDFRFAGTKPAQNRFNRWAVFVR